MKRLVFVLLAATALVGACSEDPVFTSQPEVFQGSLVMTPVVLADPMLIYPDSTAVTLTVEGTQYDLVQAEETQFNLCDSRGSVIGFGTNAATFTPTGLLGSAANCDSVRIPNGTFTTVFRGDSLLIGPKSVGFAGAPGDTMIFHFKLRQVQ